MPAVATGGDGMPYHIPTDAMPYQKCARHPKLQVKAPMPDPTLAPVVLDADVSGVVHLSLHNICGVKQCNDILF